MTKRRYGLHDLGHFVTYSIQWSPDPIGRVKSLLNNAISDFMEELTDQPKKENGTEAYPTLKYTTFNLYYAPMIQYLVEKWENDICNRPIAKRLVHKLKASKQTRTSKKAPNGRGRRNARRLYTS